MATVTLSSKGQITIPAEMVRALSLKPGDKLTAELIDDHIVLLPTPESWVDYFKGSMKGVYGSTLREIDDYVGRGRYGPERQEWLEQFHDLMATGEDVRVVVEALRSLPGHKADANELHEYLLKNNPLGSQYKPDGRKEGAALEKLVKHGGVRRVTQDDGKADTYRLVREVAQP